MWKRKGKKPAANTRHLCFVWFTLEHKRPGGGEKPGGWLPLWLGGRRRSGSEPTHRLAKAGRQPRIWSRRRISRPKNQLDRRLKDSKQDLQRQSTYFLRRMERASRGTCTDSHQQPTDSSHTNRCLHLAQIFAPCIGLNSTHLKI